MIRLKLTKDKFISIIKVVEAIIHQIETNLSVQPRDIVYARMNADIFELKELSRKMRSKLVMMEDHQRNHPFKYTITPTQASCIMQYKNSCSYDSYSISVIQEISVSIFHKLLQ